MGPVVGSENQSAPENMSKPASTSTTARIVQERGWIVIYHRQSLNNNNVKESLNGIPDHYLEGVSVVYIFLMFFPRDILESIFLVETKKNLKKKKLEVAYFCEFIQWIGVCIFMSTLSSFGCYNFWSIQPIYTFRGALYFFHRWMSLRRLQGILRNITYTDWNPPNVRELFMVNPPVDL